MVRTITRTVKADSVFHKRLDEFLQQLTDLYNGALYHRLRSYDWYEKTISKYEQFNELTEVREQDKEFEKFNVVAQRSVLERLDNAYSPYLNYLKNKKAGKKVGRPKYKGPNRPVRSFETNNYKNIEKIGRRTYLTIKGLGRLSFKGSMPDGVVLKQPKTTIRIVKTAIRIKIQFLCEFTSEKKRPMDRSIGIDLGIINRMAFSDGTKIPGVRLNRKELKRKQRIVSRAVKGSDSRKKKVLSLAKEWERTTDRENNAIHRMTTEIVKKNNHIKLEDLKIQNMVKNPYLARSVTEQQWGKIKTQLDYKAEIAGGKLVLVNSHYTTMTCSECGKVNPKLPLSERVFNCIYCGYSEDRDINAGKNINTLNEGDFISGGNKVEILPMSAKSIRSKENRDRGTLHSEQYE